MTGDRGVKSYLSELSLTEFLHHHKTGRILFYRAIRTNMKCKSYAGLLRKIFISLRTVTSIYRDARIICFKRISFAGLIRCALRVR